MTKDEILKLIAHHACELRPELKTHEFRPSDNLEDLGADSIDRVDILNLVMESMSLQLPRIAVYGSKNIGEFADKLYEKVHSA